MSAKENLPQGSGVDDSSSGKLTFRKGRWIDGWDSENNAQWEREGSKIAKRNLGFSIYAEFLGFVVWQLWSIVVVSLNGWYGFSFDSSQQFWLISLPSLVGATLRFPYTFMVSAIGGRNWTIVSAALLLIPTTAMAFAISNHPTVDPVSGVVTGGTTFCVMLLIAALGGFGGGNFASSMANITFFYPQRMKGWALGLNAAGGNIGAAVAQFTVPILITITAAAVTSPNEDTTRIVNLPIAGWFWIPFILLGIAGAIWGMNNLSSAKADSQGYMAALKEPHMWLLSFLYIGTFGSFIGLAGAFPKLIADQFKAYSMIHIGIVGIGLAFLGPLTGSLVRPFGGKLADKVGGAYVTVAAFIVMILATFSSIQVLKTARQAENSNNYFWAFLACFIVLFAATGVGNGSMYKMIPTVFAYKAGQMDAHNKSAGISTVRKTSAALGIVSAFGAYGGFLVPQVFNKATTMKKLELGEEGAWVVEGYQLGLWWLFFAYIIFLVTLVAFYIIPYMKKGTRV
ncbi:MAG: MFS transporter [Propionibacteriaceae bacterium]|nr:MFS transporter [Propionibacteriaceae bacterium]